MDKQRINWIDVAKGIAIISVIIGHATGPESLRIIVYSYHMPLFFFLSGLMHSDKRELPDLVVHKAQSLLVPWLIFAVLKITFDGTVGLLHGDFNSLPAYIAEHMVGLIFGIRFGAKYVTTFWFVTALFICEIFGFLVFRFVKGNKKRSIFLFSGAYWLCMSKAPI